MNELLYLIAGFSVGWTAAILIGQYAEYKEHVERDKLRAIQREGKALTDAMLHHAAATRDQRRADLN